MATDFEKCITLKQKHIPSCKLKSNCRHPNASPVFANNVTTRVHPLVRFLFLWRSGRNGSQKSVRESVRVRPAASSGARPAGPSGASASGTCCSSCGSRSCGAGTRGRASRPRAPPRSDVCTVGSVASMPSSKFDRSVLGEARLHRIRIPHLKVLNIQSAAFVKIFKICTMHMVRNDLTVRRPGLRRLFIQPCDRLDAVCDRLDRRTSWTDGQTGQTDTLDRLDRRTDWTDWTDLLVRRPELRRLFIHTLQQTGQHSAAVLDEISQCGDCTAEAKCSKRAARGHGTCCKPNGSRSCCCCIPRTSSPRRAPQGLDIERRSFYQNPVEAFCRSFYQKPSTKSFFLLQILKKKLKGFDMFYAKINIVSGILKLMIY